MPIDWDALHCRAQIEYGAGVVADLDGDMTLRTLGAESILLILEAGAFDAASGAGTYSGGNFYHIDRDPAGLMLNTIALSPTDREEIANADKWCHIANKIIFPTHEDTIRRKLCFNPTGVGGVLNTTLKFLEMGEIEFYKTFGFDPKVMWKGIG